MNGPLLGSRKANLDRSLILSLKLFLGLGTALNQKRYNLTILMAGTNDLGHGRDPHVKIDLLQYTTHAWRGGWRGNIFLKLVK
jgi:hypothetical protein